MPVSAVSEVTPASLMPQGTIRSYHDRSQSQLSASPCMVTPRATRAPIAPTFRSGCPPDAGSHAPERPSTRIASSPNSAQTPDHRLLEGPHVRHHVHRLAQLHDRVRGELAGAVPGDLAAAVDVDDRRPGVAERPVGHRRPLAGGVDRRVLEQQAAVRDLAENPPPVHRALRLPGLAVVHGFRAEADMRVHEFSIHTIETTTLVIPARQLGRNPNCDQRVRSARHERGRPATAGSHAGHVRLPGSDAGPVHLAPPPGRGAVLGHRLRRPGRVDHRARAHPAPLVPHPLLARRLGRVRHPRVPRVRRHRRGRSGAAARSRSPSC